jgi:hypothetical protein
VSKRSCSASTHQQVLRLLLYEATDWLLFIRWHRDVCLCIWRLLLLLPSW